MQNNNSFELHKHFLELSQDLICIAGFDGYFKYVNPAWKEVLGYTEDELLSKPFIYYVHPNDHTNDINEFNRLKRGNKTVDFEDRYICKDGTIRFIQWKATPVLNEELIYCIGRDVTNSKENESLVYDLIEQSPIAIQIHDTEGNLLHANNAFKTLYAINDEILTQLYEKYNILKDKQILQIGIMPQIKQLFEGEANQWPIFEYELVKTLNALNIDNYEYHKCWVQSKGVPIKDEKNNILHVVIMSEDVSLQKKFEQELELSRKKFKSLYRNALVALFRVEINTGKAIEANNEAAKLFGYQNIEDFKTNFRSINHYANPQDRDSVLKELKHVGYIGRILMNSKKVDGTIIWNEASFNLDKEKGIIDCASVDVSARHQAEINLLNSESKFRNVFEQSMVSMFIADINGFIIDHNPAYEKLWQITKEEALEIHKTYNLLHDEELIRKNLSSLIKKAFNGESVQLPEIEYNAKYIKNNLLLKHIELGKIWIKPLLYPLKNECNEVTHVVVFEENVTEQKITQEQLLIAKNRAEENDRLKSAFLTNMSHEIRTPMNGILGFANLLKEPELSGEEQKKYISIIEKSGQRMLNTIHNIIDISKIESGQIRTFILEVNIDHIFTDIHEFFMKQAEAKGLMLTFSNQLNEKQTTLKTDKEKLIYILTNLIRNAIKFTEKGSIEVSCMVHPDINSNEIYFTIKDTGIGIPANRLNAIFDRFVQADIEDHQAYQGSGLGLSISKAYIKMLGGRIWVDSDTEKGSTFHFTVSRS